MSVVAIKKTSSNSDMRSAYDKKVVCKWNKTEDVKIDSFINAVHFKNRGDCIIVDKIISDVLKKYSRDNDYWRSKYNLDEFISLMNKTKEDEKNPVENWRKSFEEIMLTYILLV